MTELHWNGGWRVRVWVTADKFTMGPDMRVQDILLSVVPRIDPEAPNVAIECVAATLDQLHAEGVPIAAYEILNDDGDGALVYPDWS